MKRSTTLFGPLLSAALLAVGGAAHAQGSATSGLEIFVQPARGHCIACHRLPVGSGPATRADVGPALEGPRMRTLGKPALRRIIEDPTVDRPETVMPPFGRHRILDATEIGRVVDFLHALP